MYASQAAKSVRVVTPPGINEAVLRFCCVHNCDNHDVNNDLVNDRGPMCSDTPVLYSLVYGNWLAAPPSGLVAMYLALYNKVSL